MKTLTKLFAVFSCLGLVVAGIVGFYVYKIYLDLPDISSLDEYNPATPSRILSKDQEVLFEVGSEKRDLVAFKDIPPKVVEAFLAAEDSNFYEHHGIDIKGIIRAMIKNIKAGRVVQGASTITQQVAKTLLLTSERTYTRKIKDLLLAIKIEQKYSKEQILYLYLNQVYLGGGYYGVKEAFHGYFDKELENASIAESALVAGLLVAPSRYSPYVNPKYAKKRQTYVLGRLFKTQKITEQQYREALDEDIKMFFRRANFMKAGYFTDWVRQRVIKQFGEEKFLTGGLEVQTSLNWDLQKKAEKYVENGVRQVDKRQGFKGAISKVDDIANFVKAQRIKIIKQKSKFFIFTNEGENKNEFQSTIDYADGIEQIEKNKFSQIDDWMFKSYEPGVNDDDQMQNFVKLGEYYKAVVTKVNNSQRLIYVKFAGGLSGIIPQEHFKWARKRKISEKYIYKVDVEHPSRVVSSKDVVLVKVQKKPQSLWTHLFKSYRKNLKNKTLISALKKENYYILSLEQEPEVQSALVAMLPKNGEIITMVGGSNFQKSQFNRATQSKRQPGSSFKPFIFAAALENGFHPATMIMDTPMALESSQEDLNWKPQNYDGDFKGEMTLRRALETSRNIPTIKLVQHVGIKKLLEFFNRFKIEVEYPKDLSVSLGSFGMNLVDLVTMYGVFPNNGKIVKAKSILSIKDKNGQELFIEEVKKEAIVEKLKDDLYESVVSDKEEEDEELKEKPNPFTQRLNDKRIYDARLAYLMNNLMKGVVQNGTGRKAKVVSPHVAGKTGTTNDYIDAWFLGYSPKIVTGVWTGFDTNITLGHAETGANASLPTWIDYMKDAIKVYGDNDYRYPGGLVNLAINTETGQRALLGTEGSYVETFVEGFTPEEQSEENLAPEETGDNLFDDEDYYSNQ